MGRINFSVVTIDISVSVLLWNRALFPSLGEVCVKCLSAGGDSLVDTGACCITLASYVLLMVSKEMEP